MKEKVTSKRNILAIPALLNEVSIHPLTKVPEACFANDYSPISSGSSSPSDPSSVITETPDIWNYSTRGMHQTNNVKITSSLTKGKRKRILPYQYNRLIDVFHSTDTPSSEVRERLADELSMTKREVQVWFQNRRAKVNRSTHHLSQRNFSPNIPFDSIKNNISPHNAINMLAYVAEMMRES